MCKYLGSNDVYITGVTIRCYHWEMGILFPPRDRIILYWASSRHAHPESLEYLEGQHLLEKEIPLKKSGILSSTALESVELNEKFLN